MSLLAAWLLAVDLATAAPCAHDRVVVPRGWCRTWAGVLAIAVAR